MSAPMMRIVLVLAVGCASANSTAPTPVPSREVVSGAGRVKGGSFHMDVQIGQAISPRGAKNVVANP